jgi:predicted nuclease of predicted toxin-antitoxin system
MSSDEGSVLLTADKDFGDPVFRQGLVHAGVVLIRLAGKTPEEKAFIVAALIDQYEDEVPGNFSVLTKNMFRIRRGL